MIARLLVRGLAACLVVAGFATPNAEASCVPGFDYAAFGDSCVRFAGNNYSDAWDSSTTPVTSPTTPPTSGGNIGTNGTTCSTTACSSTASGAITLGGSATTIYGTASYGVAGSSCSVDEGSGNVTGAIAALPAPVTLTSVTIPMASNSPAIVTNDATHGPGTTWTINSATTLAPNKRYGTINASRNITISAGTYVFDKFTISGANRQLIVSSGPALMYIAGDTGNGTMGNGLSSLSGPQLSFTGSGAGINVASGKPSDLVLLCGDDVTSAQVMSAGTNGYFAMYCPKTAVAVAGNSAVYGAIVGASVRVEGGAPIHYDKALASFSFGNFTCAPPGEMSRAAPIIATLGTARYLVQGTYDTQFATKTTLTTANASTWQFKYITGHMRARLASSITTSASKFDTGTSLFDAKDELPAVKNSGCAALDGSCRKIFTNTNADPTSGGATFHPTTVTLSDSSSSTVGPRVTAPLAGTWTSTHHQAITRAILAAPLGGVDRSTVAVIPPSALAGRSTRPTMGYFGGTDGMLHAVCMEAGGSTESSMAASVASVCPAAGAELWAFLPRVQLPLVGTLDTRIDGSVHVVDAIGDFTTQAMTGLKTYRTVLVFQTGFSNATGKAAAYAIDITDPVSPVLLWEYVRPSAAGTVDFGAGLVAAPGRALISGTVRNFVVLTTNNGGSSANAGIAATALQLETGAKLWQFTHTYSTTDPVPDSGIPGGAVAVDLDGIGYVTDLVFGDLYGSLWRLDAKTGASVTGTNTPLFRFSTVRHPIGAEPAIYSNGNSSFAVFASGGYTDPTAASLWSTTTQYLIAIKIAPSTTTFPLNETASACDSCDLHVKATLSNERAFAQATIVGTTLQLVTDSEDVNAAAYGRNANTGSLKTIDLGTRAISTTVVYSGASSIGVDKSSGTATFYSSSANRQQQVSDGVATAGISVDIVEAAKLVRMLWLRTQ